MKYTTKPTMLDFFVETKKSDIKQAITIIQNTKIQKIMKNKKILMSGIKAQ